MLTMLSSFTTSFIAPSMSSKSEFFRKFHAAYVEAVSNPFHVPGKTITSRTFAQTVSNIVGSYGQCAIQQDTLSGESGRVTGCSWDKKSSNIQLSAEHNACLKSVRQDYLRFQDR